MRLLGPGTLIACACAGLVFYSKAYRIKSGIHPATVSVTRPPRLWKPQPALLLHDPSLRLSPGQVKRIERVDKAWQAARRTLLSQMSAEQPQPNDGAAIRSELADYSKSSRQFDATRSVFWLQSLAILSDAQRLIESKEKS